MPNQVNPPLGSIEVVKRDGTQFTAYRLFEGSGMTITQLDAQSATLSSGAQPSAWTQASWYIDPVSGDDNASGAQGAPLRTYAELVRRWGTTAPVLNQDTFVYFLNDQPDFTDPVEFAPTLNACNAYLVGTPKALVTDVISAFTAINRSAGTDNQVTGTAVTDFTPYRGMLMRVALTSIATKTAGSSPPASTFSGTPVVDCEPLQVAISFGGTLGVAKFSWFLNGVLQEKDVLTTATYALGATGLTMNFVAGTYTTSHVYTANSAAYAWIDTPTGSMDPGVSPIGPTTVVSATMGLGKPIGAAGLQWAPQLRTQSYGTSAPAASFTGVPQQRLGYIQVNITTGGTVGNALFSWSLNGVLQAANVVTASAVSLGNTGVVINFAAGTYQTDNVYTGTSESPYSGPDWGPPPPFQSLANGLSFTIYQPTKVYLKAVSAQPNGVQTPLASASVVKVQDLWSVFPNTPPLGFPAPMVLEGGEVEFHHCRIDARYLHGEALNLHGFTNCFFLGGFTGKSLWFYGGIFGPNGPFLVGPTAGGGFGITVDGDTIFHFSPGVYDNALVIGCAHLKGGSITCRNLGDLYITPNGRGIFYNAAAGGATALWGSGNIVLRDGRSLRIVNTSGVTATTALLITGTPTVTIDGLSAAADPLATYNGAGVWATLAAATTPLATLVAALDAGAPAGGQMYAIQNPHTGTKIVMNGNNNIG